MATRKTVSILSDTPPIHSGPRRTGSIQQKLEPKEVIQRDKPCFSDLAVADCSLSIIFVPNERGSLCFCVDYCRHHAVAVSDRYVILRMDEYIDFLREAKLLPILDANLGYRQIELTKKTLIRRHLKLTIECIGTPKCFLA